MDEALEARMAQFQHAVEHRDVAEAEAVLHPDFALVLVHPSPAVMPRARWLATLPDYVVHSWSVLEHQTDLDGDCAGVLQRVNMRATVLGVDRSGDFILSDFWRRGSSGWQIWRRHSSPLAAGPMPGA